MNSQLSLYLDNEDFYMLLFDFWEGFNHFGECGKEGYLFYSNVYKKFNNSDWKKYLFERLTKEKVEFYFTKSFYHTEQLFAIIFAYANNLPDIQIRQIENRKFFKKIWDTLNCFLCDREKRTTHLNSINYTVVIDNCFYKAELIDDCLLISNTKEKFKIDERILEISNY